MIPNTVVYSSLPFQLPFRLWEIRRPIREPTTTNAMTIIFYPVVTLLNLQPPLFGLSTMLTPHAIWVSGYPQNYQLAM